MQRLGKGEHPSNKGPIFQAWVEETKYQDKLHFSSRRTASFIRAKQVLPLPCYRAKLSPCCAGAASPVPRQGCHQPGLCCHCQDLCWQSVPQSEPADTREGECPSLTWHSSLQSGSDRAPGTGMSSYELEVFQCVPLWQACSNPSFPTEQLQLSAASRIM